MSSETRSSAAAWRAELRACFTLGLPLVLTNAIEMALNLTSAAMIGRIAPEALAASTLALALYNVCLMFGIGLAAAVSPLIARQRGDSRGAESAARETESAARDEAGLPEPQEGREGCRQEVKEAAWNWHRGGHAQGRGDVESRQTCFLWKERQGPTTRP